METQELQRVFRYNSVELPDPGIGFDIQQVRDLYAATYPEIVNAGIDGPDEKDGKLVYTFRRAVGRKGIAPRGPHRNPLEHSPLVPKYRGMTVGQLFEHSHTDPDPICA